MSSTRKINHQTSKLNRHRELPFTRALINYLTQIKVTFNIPVLSLKKFQHLKNRTFINQSTKYAIKLSYFKKIIFHCMQSSHHQGINENSFLLVLLFTMIRNKTVWSFFSSGMKSYLIHAFSTKSELNLVFSELENINRIIPTTFSDPDAFIFMLLAYKLKYIHSAETLLLSLTKPLKAIFSWDTSRGLLFKTDKSAIDNLYPQEVLQKYLIINESNEVLSSNNSFSSFENASFFTNQVRFDVKKKINKEITKSLIDNEPQKIVFDDTLEEIKKLDTFFKFDLNPDAPSFETLASKQSNEITEKNKPMFPQLKIGK